ncbi:MAG: gliding motility-associated C-terminal domain-containing protein [Saprospiraceae bacterium]|nr:gliding motility-associated C-terminal domain-containing protein [Saprospiraceae bacterium]
MKVKLYLTGFVFWMTLLTPLAAQICDCVTTGNCPVPILDNGSFQGTLDVTVNGPNDLGQCPLTSVCFSITHTWVGDLAVTLTSPSGLNYMVMADQDNQSGCGTQDDNVDVCIYPGTGNPLTNNTEYICNTGPCQSGTCCLVGGYTMPCGGVTDPITGAQQAPNCNLNDFNVPGNPANGTWTLTVNDVCSQDVGTLNNFSLTFACGTQSCTVCEADAGDLNDPDIQGCFGDAALNLNLTPVFSNGGPPDPGQYSYAYVISQNLFITQVVPSSDMSNFPPGVYSICGLSYLTSATANIQSLVGMNLNAAKNLLASTTAPFCGDISDNCIIVTIGPAIPPTVLDTSVCIGECITVCNQTVCQSGTVTCQSYLGCDSLVNVVMIPIPPIVTNANLTVCAGECLEVDGNLYCPPGPHFITYNSWLGCDSTVNLTMTEVVTQAIINPNPPPAITCSNPTVVLNGMLSLPANVQYHWVGPNFNSVQPVVTVSQPGTYTLTVTNNALIPPCTSSVSVTVTGSQSNPDLQVNPPLPVICQGGSFDLSTLNIIDLNNTNPVITFHSGTPANAANQLPSTVVSPSDTTTYYILGTKGNCHDEVSVQVAVIANLTADFSVVSPICVDGETTVIYTGNAIAGATYNWNFGGGTATPGTGPGPHNVSWATGGTKTITLVVQGNGCTSDPVSHTVVVNSFIPDPVINCYPTLGSIEFVWNTIPGAAGYNVNVATGPTGTLTSDTSYVVTGLNPGDQSSIFVEAISGNACGNVSTQITCIAQDCPSVTVAIDPVPDICLDATTVPINLTATATGGAGGGLFTWTGPAVNPITGLFNPANANAGSNAISVSYEEGTCLYNASTVLNVYPQPSVSFTVTSPICISDNASVNYTGNASSGAVYTWDFSGGTATPPAGPGPLSVNWPVGGTYNLSLVVEENGYLSETGTMAIQVEEPLPVPIIQCNSGLTDVEFFWNTIPGATGYDVVALAGGAGSFNSDTSYLVGGLTAGDVVSVQVTAFGAGPCGNSMAIANCTADDCPNISISIDPVANICRDAATAPFDLTAIITGGSGGGVLSWSGSGITDTASGIFDPQQAVIGANTVTVLYEENGCLFTADLSVFVYQTPVAGFTMNTPVCENETATVTYTGTNVAGLTLTWDFDGGTAIPGIGNGPHSVSWATGGAHPVSLLVTNAQGCASDTFSLVEPVSTPLIDPAISCNQTTTAIEFTWDAVANATAYDVSVTSGQMGQSGPNSFLVENLDPGDVVSILLTVVGDGVCPDAVVDATCFALDCPDVVIDVSPVAPLCKGQASTLQLNATVTGGSSGTGEWSGNGIVDAVNGIFDPGAVVAGQHVITYSYDQDNCHYEGYTTIEVFDTPTSEFSATQHICLTDAATVAFTGSAGANATYTWDFGSGSAVPGTGPGPHQVVWPIVGDHIITLTVEQDGCVAAASSVSVQVDPVLETPVIDCTSNTESVQFTWNVVPGATSYDVQVVGGTAVNQPGTAYSINSLLPGDALTIQVTANGNTICPLPIAEATCAAAECPDVDIALTAVGPLCFTSLSTPINLEALVANGSGSGSWDGDGVVNSTGIFDLAVAGIGTHTLTYTYDEAPNCVFSKSMDITIVAAPVADAGQGATLTCMDDEMEAVLGGSASSAGPNITYGWDASFGPFPGDSTILHPIVTQAGTYTLTVTNTDLGCTASDQVVIGASQELPQIEFTLTPISCYGEKDGAVSITGIQGGIPPYLYSFNGSAFGSHTSFLNLEPGVYSLAVLDANGCQSSVTIDMQQPQEVNVDLIVYLEGDNVVLLGESVEMEADATPDSLDWVHWEPSALVSCDTCMRVTSTPLQATTFTVTVESNGCSDSDEMTIYVKKDRPIFIPNAFSPNNDGRNDVFFIYAGGNIVSRIKSFLVFDRWGETVFQYYNFQPNDPAFGWDGNDRGQPLNPAVFTWFAEIEFVDGVTEILEGDVVLMK